MTELHTLDLLYFDGVENEEGDTRPIFIPNACHVCKYMRDSGSSAETVSCNKLLSCSGCRLIAYCGAPHQKQHWSQHKVTPLILSTYIISIKFFINISGSL